MDSKDSHQQKQQQQQQQQHQQGFWPPEANTPAGFLDMNDGGVVVVDPMFAMMAEAAAASQSPQGFSQSSAPPPPPPPHNFFHPPPFPPALTNMGYPPPPPIHMGIMGYEQEQQQQQQFHFHQPFYPTPSPPPPPLTFTSTTTPSVFGYYPPQQTTYFSSGDSALPNSIPTPPLVPPISLPPPPISSQQIERMKEDEGKQDENASQNAKNEMGAWESALREAISESGAAVRKAKMRGGRGRSTFSDVNEGRGGEGDYNSPAVRNSMEAAVRRVLAVAQQKNVDAQRFLDFVSTSTSFSSNSSPPPTPSHQSNFQLEEKLLLLLCVHQLLLLIPSSPPSTPLTTTTNSSVVTVAVEEAGSPSKEEQQQQALPLFYQFVRTQLEREELTPQELITLLELASQLVHRHPTHVGAHLHELCDFIFGWLLDSEEDDSEEGLADEGYGDEGDSATATMKSKCLATLGILAPHLVEESCGDGRKKESKGEEQSVLGGFLASLLDDAFSGSVKRRPNSALALLGHITDSGAFIQRIVVSNSCDGGGYGGDVNSSNNSSPIPTPVFYEFCEKLAQKMREVEKSRNPMENNEEEEEELEEENFHFASFSLRLATLLLKLSRVVGNRGDDGSSPPHPLQASAKKVLATAMKHWSLTLPEDAHMAIRIAVGERRNAELDPLQTVLLPLAKRVLSVGGGSNDDSGHGETSLVTLLQEAISGHFVVAGGTSSSSSSQTQSPPPLAELQASYTKVIAAIEEGVDELKRYEELELEELKNDAGDTSRVEKVLAAERMVELLVKALEPLTRVKGSIIVLRGLQPSLFSLLLVERLPIGDPFIITHFPHLHHTLLHAAVQFAETHDNFHANSSISTQLQLKQKEQPSQQPSQQQQLFTLGTSTSPTSTYFASIIQLLAEKLLPRLAAGELGEPAVAALVLQWLDSVAGCLARMVQSQPAILEEHPLVVTLRKGALHALVRLLIPNHPGFLSTRSGGGIKALLLEAVDRLDSMRLLLRDESSSGDAGGDGGFSSLFEKQIAEELLRWIVDNDDYSEDDATSDGGGGGRNWDSSKAERNGEGEKKGWFEEVWSRLSTQFQLKLFSSTQSLVFPPRANLNTTPTQQQSELSDYELRVVIDYLTTPTCQRGAPLQDGGVGKNAAADERQISGRSGVASGQLIASVVGPSVDPFYVIAERLVPTLRGKGKDELLHSHMQGSCWDKWRNILEGGAQLCFPPMSVSAAATNSQEQQIGNSNSATKKVHSAIGKRASAVLSAIKKSLLCVSAEGDSSAEQPAVNATPSLNTTIAEWKRHRLLVMFLAGICEAARQQSNSPASLATAEAAMEQWLEDVIVPYMRLCYSVGEYAEIIKLANSSMRRYQAAYGEEATTTLMAPHYPNDGMNDDDDEYEGSLLHNSPHNPQAKILQVSLWLLRVFVAQRESQAASGVMQWLLAMRLIDAPTGQQLGHVVELAAGRYNSALAGLTQALQGAFGEGSPIPALLREMHLRVSRNSAPAQISKGTTAELPSCGGGDLIEEWLLAAEMSLMARVENFFPDDNSAFSNNIATAGMRSSGEQRKRATVASMQHLGKQLSQMAYFLLGAASCNSSIVEDDWLCSMGSRCIALYGMVQCFLEVASRYNAQQKQQSQQQWQLLQRHQSVPQPGPAINIAYSSPSQRLTDLKDQSTIIAEPVSATITNSTKLLQALLGGQRGAELLQWLLVEFRLVGPQTSSSSLPISSLPLAQMLTRWLESLILIKQQHTIPSASAATWKNPGEELLQQQLATVLLKRVHLALSIRCRKSGNLQLSEQYLQRAAIAGVGMGHHNPIVPSAAAAMAFPPPVTGASLMGMPPPLSIGQLQQQQQYPCGDGVPFHPTLPPPPPLHPAQGGSNRSRGGGGSTPLLITRPMETSSDAGKSSEIISSATPSAHIAGANTTGERGGGIFGVDWLKPPRGGPSPAPSAPLPPAGADTGNGDPIGMEEARQRGGRMASTSPPLLVKPWEWSTADEYRQTIHECKLKWLIAQQQQHDQQLPQLHQQQQQLLLQSCFLQIAQMCSKHMEREQQRLLGTSSFSIALEEEKGEFSNNHFATSESASLAARGCLLMAQWLSRLRRQDSPRQEGAQTPITFSLLQLHPHSLFFKQLLQSMRYLESVLASTADEVEAKEAEQDLLLEGALVLTACGLGGRRPNLAKAHKALADWAIAAAAPSAVQERVGGGAPQGLLFELALSSYLRFADAVTSSENGKEKIASSSFTARRLELATVGLRLVDMLARRPSDFARVVGGPRGIAEWLKERPRVAGALWAGDGGSDNSCCCNAIPQLFALLAMDDGDGGEGTVSECAIQILRHIAQHSPHVICFKVATYSSAAAEATMKTAEEPVDLKFTKSRNKKLVQRCKELSASLIDEYGYGEMMRDVGDFCTAIVDECVWLPDERWHTAIVEAERQLASVAAATSTTRVVAEMEVAGDDVGEEQQGVATGGYSSKSGGHSDYQQAMEHIRSKLRQLQHECFEIAAGDTTVGEEDEATAKRGSTPAHRHFAYTYRVIIADALDAFDAEMCATSPPNPAKAWSHVKKLQELLAHQINRRANIDLAQMSPRLAAVCDSRVPMPGINNGGQIVTIARVLPTVTVLPTKTRPKRITFVGSDGKEYSYLVKANEDLNLDERVAQLLSLSNLILAHKCNRNNNPTYSTYPSQVDGYSTTPHHAFECSTYPIITLGPRCGLIRWVDGATPLYRIYQRWLQQQTRSSSSAQQPQQPQPIELFHSKLKRLQHQADSSTIHRSSSTSAVAAAAREAVLVELMRETPRDLLERELLLATAATGCHNTAILDGKKCDEGAMEWWRRAKRFARSCAVASILGSLVGLGDRHLENVLVNLSTGQVVHVDYNICFERGRRLRVPEVVPFRLSPNMVGAMGPTGIEGVFRESAHRVMEALRSRAGCDALQLLVAGFARDPFIEWRQVAGSGATDRMAATAAGGENASAEVVARRIRAKLEGREETKEGGHHQLTAKEQSDFLIERATNVSLLALMYEGWSAWV